MHALLYCAISAYGHMPPDCYCKSIIFYNPVGDCLGPGFTTTIPALGQRSQYSTTVLGPGGGAIYTALSFTCTGTLQSLTIPTEVRGSEYSYWSQNLRVWISIWRFNKTGYYKVREYQISRWTRRCFFGCSKLAQNDLYQYSDTITTNIDILANDILGFQLRQQDSGIYRHLPLLYKPGPTPGTFIPIVSANITASSTSECKGNLSTQDLYIQ